MTSLQLPIISKEWQWMPKLQYVAMYTCDHYNSIFIVTYNIQ